MKLEKILFINACLREESRTLELTKQVLNSLQGETQEVKLYDLDLQPLDLKGLAKRNKANMNKDFSDKVFDLAKQFSKAETIVIAAPYWDLMFPSILKIYFENITISGLTFVYVKDGRPKGLCNAKKLIYVTTSGGPIIQNFGYDYTNALAKMFFGIKTVKFISAQGLDIYGANITEILNKAIDTISIVLQEE